MMEDEGGSSRWWRGMVGGEEMWFLEWPRREITDWGPRFWWWWDDEGARWWSATARWEESWTWKLYVPPTQADLQESFDDLVVKLESEFSDSDADSIHFMSDIPDDDVFAPWPIYVGPQPNSCTMSFLEPGEFFAHWPMAYLRPIDRSIDRPTVILHRWVD